MIAPADFSAPSLTDRTKPKQADRVANSRQEALYDTGLVRRFHAGDEPAFAEIVTRYRERMFAVAFAMLRNHGDAEEIAQDTFVRAHRGLAKFRGDSSLSTWLHRIALNLSRNRYWYFFRRSRHATVSLDASCHAASPATFAELIATADATPVRAAAASEFTELVAACLARLGEPHREILRRRNSLTQSYEEIARSLGISVGTVKSRIARARQNLRTLLNATCPEFGVDAQPADWFDPVRSAGGLEVIRP
jgi:RNA polymerase sigma-70 factor (ECF subfamily)